MNCATLLCTYKNDQLSQEEGKLRAASLRVCEYESLRVCESASLRVCEFVDFAIFESPVSASHMQDMSVETRTEENNLSQNAK